MKTDVDTDSSATQNGAPSTTVERETIRPTKAHEVLVVNRDPELRVLLGRALYAAQLSSTLVSLEGEAFASLKKSAFGLIVVGIESQESIDFVTRVSGQIPAVPLVAVARTATPDLVRDVLRAGAADFFFGSLDSRAFGARLASFLEARDVPSPESPVSRRARGPTAIETSAHTDARGGVEDVKIISSSKRMRRVLEISDTIAPSDSTVLIQGESGTGKELMAKRIHRLSRRSSRPFVEVNCGAIPENLLESQLFGHEKGSFTGAVQRQIGLFEIADQGTLFLDEVGETSLDMQVKLLRVLQFREFRRIGGSQTVKVDVRVIAATNRDLKVQVENNQFRSDLFYRLNVILLEVPPLRERLEEIPELVDLFAERVAREQNVARKHFTEEAISHLRKYRWTGNVRELENAVERLVLLSKKEIVDAADLEEHLGASTVSPVSSPFVSSMTLDEVKKIHITNVLRDNEGNKMKTARVLEINVKTLYNLMKKLEIQ